jgi:hypothetical protein
MIGPWDVIGWIVLLVFFLGVILFAYLFFSPIVRHVLTKDIPLVSGQVWRNNTNSYLIGEWVVSRYWVRSGSSSWLESPADFRKRILEHRLYLVEGSK